MTKALRRRVEQLKQRLGPPKTSHRFSKQERDRWLAWLDDWPEEFLVHNRSNRPSEEKIAALREECRQIAARMRAGELKQSSEMFDALPDDVLLGLRVYMHQQERARARELRNPRRDA